MTPKRLTVTEAMVRALAALDAVEAGYVPGRDFASEVEVHKIHLANAVLAALADQRDRSTRSER